MSRFEAGGLALIIKGYKGDYNIGKTVTLIKYIGDRKDFKDVWEISAEGIIASDLTHGKAGETMYIEKHRLIPLGDRKSQGELRQETMKYPHLESANIVTKFSYWR